MLPERSAVTSAAVSTTGPREVFTSIADRFIRASSAAPTSPVLRGDSL
jgi:hypothetical protein